MKRISDADLKTLANAIHRQFWGAYTDRFPDVVLELFEARKLSVPCHICGKEPKGKVNECGAWKRR